MGRLNCAPTAIFLPIDELEVVVAGQRQTTRDASACPGLEPMTPSAARRGSSPKPGRPALGRRFESQWPPAW